MKRASLVNNADGGFLRVDDHLAYVIKPVSNFRLEFNGGLDGRLRMKLGGKTDFEQYVFHNVAAKRL